MMRSTLLALGWALVSLPAAASAQWNGAPSPHDGRHLVVVRPGELRSEEGKPAVPVKDPETSFGEMVPLVSPLQARLKVRHAGEYVVWLRAAGREGNPLPIEFRLTAGAKSLLEGNLAKRKETIADGGPKGYAAFAEEAQKTLPGAKTGEGLVAKPPKSGGDDLSGDDLSSDAAEFEQELLADIAKSKGEKIKRSWTHFTRLENSRGKRPYFWHRLGELKLEPGEYTLRLSSSEKFKPADAPSIDAAFLSTTDELVYPYNGDLNAPPATYIRFRLDKLPEEGVILGGNMRVHFDPWSSSSAAFNPTGMATKAIPHTATGFTPWYRLQDIENAAPFGASEAHLLLQLQRGKDLSRSRGATQFAVYPHDDYVLREIDWDEPEAHRITLKMDIATYPESLRTFRDHARENYDYAVAATGDRVYPLTRGELYFSNAWGYDDGDSAPYMVKTLRLLGFNCAANSFDPVGNRKRYGWTSHAGEYWPPAYMPYDEAAAKKQYADFYKHHFDAQRELYEGVSIFQIADEPGEISREEMSAPLWRWRKHEPAATTAAEAKPKADAEKYVDPVGGSMLSTRDTKLGPCVLEGILEKHGTWVGFRAAMDDPLAPKRYIEWRIGKVAYSDETNVATTRVGLPAPGEGLSSRPGAVVAATGSTFKIVFEPPSVAIYLNGKLIQTQGQMPATGGFAIVGPPKALQELRLREIAKDEHISTSDEPEQELVAKTKSSELDDLDELVGKSETPTWAKQKPLRKFIEEDCTPAGGIADAQLGFRRWAQEQGLKPELFGRKSWDEVHMLTAASLVETPADARLFYWSRKYSGYLTPRMFAMAADAIAAAAPNPKMRGFVALSGHALYFPSTLPLDMFQLASGSPAMLPGISDWMSEGGWRWDSHQAVAYSVAMYNAGARRPGQEPLSYPMMHCVWPSEFRAYTMLANNVRYLSYYNYGPYYQVTEGFWSDSPDSYRAVHLANNRAAQVDDVLSYSRMRPSRVAMLYSMSNEYWDPTSSFADKRAAFLGLSHDYYQPELVTEEQIAAGALENYDALYLLEPRITAAASKAIGSWVNQGGLLWSCADAGLRNEFNEPHDLLANLAGIERRMPAGSPLATNVKEEVSSVDPNAKRKVVVDDAKLPPLVVASASDRVKFRPHSVIRQGMAASVKADKAQVLAKYDDGRPAWLEQPVGKGKLIYIGHRAGLTYTSKSANRGGFPVIWADTGRALLTAPLLAAKVDRELVLSEPIVMASPMSTDKGTVVVLYNMRGVELKKVQVSLKEPKKPYSVEYFVGDRLEPLPFEFADGRATFTLPKLTTGQMVLVRREAAPEDERPASMLARTQEQLQSDDWQTASAGAWFAGFHPEWKLGDQVLKLVEHKHWDVRRAAVESLGRMGHQPAADRLAKLIETECDPHVLSDALVALARLFDPRIESLAPPLLTDPNPFVRKHALAAVRTYARPGSQQVEARQRVKFALQAAQTAAGDIDSRVRHPAIAMLGEYVPQQAVDALLTANDPADVTHRDLAVCARAVAQNRMALEEYISRGLPGGDTVLLAVAEHQTDPKLAAAITQRAGELAATSDVPLMIAAVRQCNPELTRQLLSLRSKLKPTTENALPVILERTFDARLGRVYEDWEAQLQPGN